MAYELQQQTLDPRLVEVLGAGARIVELSYGDVRKAMALAPTQLEAAEYLTAASVQVNGQGIGIETLRALPGRLTQVIANTIKAVIALHGMQDDETPK